MSHIPNTAVTLSPSAAYAKLITEETIKKDDLQASIMEAFEALYQEVIDKKVWLFKPKYHNNGIYLWGPVGRGKTMLMDLFLNALPPKVPYKRYHYHAFMRLIHQELKKRQGDKLPLKGLAKDLKKQFSVIFLDEFFVMDIANAMILGDLLQALFKQKMVLLITSNCAPDDLYENGMLRERFMPAIEAIKTHMAVKTLLSDQDYRMDNDCLKQIVISPDDAQSDDQLKGIFHRLTKGQTIYHQPINCLDRMIEIIARSDKVLWCDFSKLCAVPRSQNDYLALSKQYDTFIVSHVPVFGDRDEDISLYFIMLIDVLYDEHKQLIITTAAALEDLFPQQSPLSGAFARTYSRLNEMQSPEYLENCRQ
jgi:cell division protein ZapE